MSVRVILNTNLVKGLISPAGRRQRIRPLLRASEAGGWKTAPDSNGRGAPVGYALRSVNGSALRRRATADRSARGVKLDAVAY